VLSLPTDNATARMRAWRSLKAAGAAVLRDGVYLLPDEDRHAATLGEVAEDVRRAGGQAQVLRAARAEAALEALFDRGADYTAWLDDAADVRHALRDGRAAEAQRQARKLRKALEQIVAIDFFAGPAREQALETIGALEAAVAVALAPDEPHPVAAGRIAPRERSRYVGRVWVTRRRPWVDRLACAWLIRRFIDPQAHFLWLESPAEGPKRAVGFDFDGATFTHVGSKVSFETLLAAFDLETPALLRLGTIVHALDAGGAQPPEAAGVERVLAGMREAIGDDDALAQAAAAVFEGLHVALSKEPA
jgi:hypothetical protein